MHGLLHAAHDDQRIRGNLSSPHCPVQGPRQPHETAAPPPRLCVRAKLQPTAQSAPATAVPFTTIKLSHILMIAIAVLVVVMMIAIAVLVVVMMIAIAVAPS